MFYKSIVISAGLLMGGIASAQDTEESSDQTISEIDQIIVSGAMTPLTINQLGSAATVIAGCHRRRGRHTCRMLPGDARPQVWSFVGLSLHCYRGIAMISGSP